MDANSKRQVTIIDELWDNEQSKAVGELFALEINASSPFRFR